MIKALEEKLRDLILAETQDAAIDEWRDTQNPSTLLYNYRLDHVTEVVKISKYLAKNTGANLEIVTIAAWLHDIAKPGLVGIKEHGKVGADMARNLLMKEGLEKTMIDQVCDVIEKHVGLTLEEPIKPLEAQIVWDADKIVKLGVVGFIHMLINGIKLFPGRDLGTIFRDMNEFIPLAERIVSSMQTQLGKKMANERFETLKMIVNMLEKELEIT